MAKQLGRRTVLKGMAAAAGGLLLPSTLARAAEAATMKILFGAHVEPTVSGPTYQDRKDALTAFETFAARKMRIDRQYRSWDTPFPFTISGGNDYDAWTVAQGRVPMLSWKA